ncbi:helix-turn-helix domain-containing protein [Tetragenococcus koreensis]|uniref:helix-turn-helix domain-containing protein n=1 Tax=Tetragenococcus koreensis TaxID=290335 RepID=UPI000F4E0B75|nr:helix-turn-helix transcriptional regulator [Tetragenococcus koreensis]AYW46512.1 hypothetical protein C7K43_11600 [Tetragenococcus koreensis]MCF1585340.1 helix-turn-helix domain-containing protein [Tetragenococcus koreensis]MCF1619756.1 helix-turn-helix domain-containing protein [Tetragenococcus koreensis]MCF1629607.1 helix-turn-helix domain-containing protein [Tetragenococcus koreensis]MCF1657239.1 helix-turn-helix domain-containing protein [Tetragenococcus koreensis]
MDLIQLNEIGPNIAKYRNKVGLSQQELADGIGLSQQTIGFIETGRRNTTIETLVKIANVLNVNLSTFFQSIENDEDEVNHLLQRIEHSLSKNDYIKVFNEIIDLTDGKEEN